jgi:hypothetical protein
LGDALVGDETLVGNRRTLDTTAALVEKKGLVELTLPHGAGICDWNAENWTILCFSFEKNTKLKSITFEDSFGGAAVSDELIQTRTRQLADALHFNTILEQLNPYHFDQTIYGMRIKPILEMNRTEFKAQRKALRSIDCDLLKAKLLGRALYAVQYNPELAWKILTENLVAVVGNEKKPKAVVRKRKRKSVSSGCTGSS